MPPPALKARIMAIVESEAALLAAAGERADRPSGARARARACRGAGAAAAELVREPVAAARLRGRLRALLLLVGGVGGAVLSGGGRRRCARSRPRSTQAQAPGAQVRLEVRDDGGDAGGRGHAAAAARGASTRCGASARARPGADRRPVERRRATARPAVAVPGSLDDVEAVLVTDEPLGGATVPSQGARDHRATPGLIGAQRRGCYLRRSRWPPATATRRARPASRARTAGTRSAPTA